MQLTYNGIQLQIIKTHSFAQQPVWSADNADWIANRYYFDVSCVYSPAAMSYTPGPTFTPGQLPAATGAALKHFLGEPRRQLTYQDEAGNVVLSSPPQGNSQDAIDGPKPIHVNVTDILGQKTWLVRFAIETFLCDCPGGGPGPLLSNRWSNSQQIGDDQMTTVITQGQSHLNMVALENLQQTADDFRNQVVPPTPLGFRRISLNVQVNTIGDKLIWQSVDRQQYYALGDSQSSLSPGVLRFEGSFTQQTVGSSESMIPSGRILNAASVAVFGKPAASRAELMIFAVKMCLNRIWPAGAPPRAPDLDGFISRVAAKEELHQPAVSVHMEANMPAAQQGAIGLGGLRADKFLVDGVNYQFNNPLLNPAGLTPDLGADNNTRTPGYLGKAFAAILQQPCVAPNPVKGPPGPGSGSPSYSTSPSYNISASVGSSVELDDSSTDWSDDNTQSLFTEYRIDNVYRTVYSKLVAAIAGPVSGSTQYGSTDSNGNWVPSNPQQPTVEVMTLAEPKTTMASEWSVERAGSEPMIPDPNPTDPAFVLLLKDVQQTNVSRAADGTTKLYRVRGRYEYAMTRPVYNECARMFPKAPNITYSDGVSDFIAELRDGLIMGDGSDDEQDTPPSGSPGGGPIGIDN